MANQSKPFRFLDLPPELRVRVYSYLFEFKQPLLLLKCLLVPLYVRIQIQNVELKPRITTGLLVACQQIHREAAPVLYGGNTFMDTTNGGKFLRTIKSYIPHIRRFIVEHSTKAERHSNFVRLKAATSLSYLEISSRICHTYSWKPRSKEDIQQALAKEMGPLFRSLHKSQKKDLDKKDRDVLDVLVISADWVSGPGKAKVMEEAKRYENGIKEALRKTLK